jgi:hypothetical protein
MVESRGERFINDPPFSAVEPGILARRASGNPDDWWTGYKDDILTARILRDLSAKYPEYARVYEIGRSLQGRPILALKISDHPDRDEDEPALFLNASHHGNEPLTIEYVLDTARYLLENSVTRRDAQALRIVNEGEVWCLPVVNPDGVSIFWNLNSSSGRKNGRDTSPPSGWNSQDGVDLNRNYPFYWNSGDPLASSSDPSNIFYRGRTPASEPEVRAVMELARKERFILSLSFHTFATKILIPYTVGSAVNPFPNTAAMIAVEMAELGKSHRTGKNYTAVKNLYPVDGTDQDWLQHEIGTYAFIVEGSHHSPDFRSASLSVAGMRPMVLYALNRFFEGPTLSLQVSDVTGMPLSAEIRILEEIQFENEKLQSDPVYGRFLRFLPREGDYTILIKRAGLPEKTVRFSCQKGITNLAIRLR